MSNYHQITGLEFHSRFFPVLTFSNNRMQSLFGLAPQPHVEISLADENTRELHNVKGGKQASYPLYFDGESVTGKV